MRHVLRLMARHSAEQQDCSRPAAPYENAPFLDPAHHLDTEDAKRVVEKMAGHEDHQDYTRP
jgi:hypothetical protein